MITNGRLGVIIPQSYEVHHNAGTFFPKVVRAPFCCTIGRVDRYECYGRDWPALLYSGRGNRAGNRDPRRGRGRGGGTEKRDFFDPIAVGRRRGYVTPGHGNPTDSPTVIIETRARPCPGRVGRLSRTRAYGKLAAYTVVINRRHPFPSRFRRSRPVYYARMQRLQPVRRRLSVCVCVCVRMSGIACTIQWVRGWGKRNKLLDAFFARHP